MLFILLALLFIITKATIEYSFLYEKAKVWSSQERMISEILLEQFYSWFTISISTQSILNVFKFLLESIIVAYLLIKFAGKKDVRKFKLILNIFAIFLIFRVLLYIIMPAGLYILALNSFMQTVDISIALSFSIFLLIYSFVYPIYLIPIMYYSQIKALDEPRLLSNLKRSFRFSLTRKFLLFIFLNIIYVIVFIRLPIVPLSIFLRNDYLILPPEGFYKGMIALATPLTPYSIVAMLYASIWQPLIYALFIVAEKGGMED